MQLCFKIEKIHMGLLAECYHSERLMITIDTKLGMVITLHLR